MFHVKKKEKKKRQIIIVSDCAIAFGQVNEKKRLTRTQGLIDITG